MAAGSGALAGFALGGAACAALAGGDGSTGGAEAFTGGRLTAGAFLRGAETPFLVATRAARPATLFFATFLFAATRLPRAARLLARTLLRFALAFAFFLVAATGSLRKRDWLVAETILAEPGGRIKRFT